MQLLKQAIVDGDTLRAAMLVAQKFTHDDCINHSASQLDELNNKILAHLSNFNNDKQKRIIALVEYFYSQLMFSSDEQTEYCSRNILINQVLAFRTGDAVLLSVVFCELARRAGFSAKGVNFPGCFLIRIQYTHNKALFLEPVTGKFLDYQRLELYYHNLLDQADDSGMPIEALDAASTGEITIKLLQDLKTAFLYEDNLEYALETIELLIVLSPDDPYERRDRGFLLQQLECPQMAKLDYQYFIRHCPQDPDAQILKTQMQKWDNQSQLIFH